PFVLESMDHNWRHQTPRDVAGRSDDLPPSELFRRHVYCTYWFEHIAPTKLFDVIPTDRVMFESDFPHPACLYNNVRETISAGLDGLPAGIRHRILWGNAADLYDVEAPVPAAARA